MMDRALQGLSPEEEQELVILLDQYPELDDESLGLSIAALELALTQQAGVEDMPAGMRDRLLQDSQRQTEVTPSPPPPVNFGVLGWLAAAASVIWMLTIWEGGSPVSAEDQYAQLVASAEDLVREPWIPLEAASKVTGEIVWSDREQQGFMRMRGLAINDPQVEQYQLWVFDRGQDDRYPIDGGVFNSDRGEILVPIDAKIPVQRAWQFAVTVEKPGGVVVSSRERLVLLAQTQSRKLDE
jgi:hypothetical protein